MNSPLGTTAFVLAWCVLLSFAWAHLAYLVAIYRRWTPQLKPTAATLGAGLIIPALVAAPLTLLLAFRSSSINLLFPVTLFAESDELFRAAFAPAVVLFCASGLASTLARQVTCEYRHWQAQPFSRLAQALGKSTAKTLYKLVLTKSLGSAWSQALPWLFGELVIVESVFNAPGLGLQAWQMARIRDHGGLLTCVIWLAALYIGCTILTAWSNRRLGRRLASYG